MRRPHRTIETFDISLMAVVTKAMGAFLVLMLLLLPYYTPDSTEDDAAELLRQLKLLDAKLDEVSTQLGDPSKTVEDLRKELDKITATTTLRAEVLAKLRGLINKAFSEIRRLEARVAELEAEIAPLREENERLREENEKLTAEIEELRAVVEPLKAEVARLKEENERLLALVEPLKAENEKLKKENEALKQENAALVAENKTLQAEIAALLARIALLEEELRRLKKNQPREQYQGVMASYDVRSCNDVKVKGTILRVGKEEGYKFEPEKTEMGADYLLQANFGMDGGTVPKQDPISQLKGAVAVRTSLPNAGMVTDQAIGNGDYLIILVKRDPNRTYEVNDKPWVFLRGSGRSCSASVAAAARAAFVDDWASNTSVLWTFGAKEIAGIPLAFTSDDKGIHFRPPKKEEEEWLARLVKLAIAAQDNIPEIKKEREEKERKAREAEEKRRKEEDERRKREEEDRKTAPTTTHVSPAQLDHARGLVRNFRRYPERSPAREGMAGIMVEVRQRVNLQIKESEDQLKTMSAGRKRERTETFLKDLRAFESEVGALIDGTDGKTKGGTENGQKPADGDLTTSHMTPRDLRMLDAMQRMYDRAAPGSPQRTSLEDRITDARRRVELQIKETEAQIAKMPPGPPRARAEEYLQELRKHGPQP